MAFDAFLKLDSIPGESDDKVHKGEIEIESFSFGVQNTGSLSGGGGGGAGKAVFQDIHFTAMASLASPKLFVACASGKHLKDATLTLRKAGKEGTADEFMKIQLQDCFVSGYQDGGNAGAEDRVPTDQFSLNFAKIEFTFSDQNGTATGSWDVLQNSGG